MVDFEAPPYLTLPRPKGAGPSWRLTRRQIALAFEERGVLLNGQQEHQLASFLEGIFRWNRSVRLTGLKSPERVLNGLLAESAEFFHLWDPPLLARVVDVGSGAGVPGVPLKILRPHLSLSIVEANQRKTAFIKEMVRQLGLEGVEVLCVRVEALSKSEEHLGRYDAVFSRGTGPLWRLLPWVWPLLGRGGLFLLRQGRRYLEETEGALRLLEGLGAKAAGERPVEGGRLLALQKGMFHVKPPSG